MAVNTLTTGMIVSRFLKVTRVKPTSVERALGSIGCNKSRHIMFIIIESGMALFAIQLVRVVLLIIPEANGRQQTIFTIAKDFAIITNQMLNVIIIKSRSVHFDMFCLLISFI